jgi:NAD(P)-dependent dehydrogenase (short-subunit alcohol dehydrogenase family)
VTSVQERLFDVRDTRVVVTGAASGLGYAMAEVLAECGARVTLADIDAGRPDASTEKLRSRGLDARSFVADVGEEDRVQALFDDVVEAQGGVDVVFANAGLAAVPGFRFDDGQTFDTIERSDWDKVLSVNLTVSCTRCAARRG